MKDVCLAVKKTDNSQGDVVGSVRGTGSETAAFGSGFHERSGEEVNPLGEMKVPQNVDVGESLDIGETLGVLREDLDCAPGKSGFERMDVGRLFVRGVDNSNGDEFDGFLHC